MISSFCHVICHFVNCYFVFHMFSGRSAWNSTSNWWKLKTKSKNQYGGALEIEGGTQEFSAVQNSLRNQGFNDFFTLTRARILVYISFHWMLTFRWVVDVCNFRDNFIRHVIFFRVATCWILLMFWYCHRSFSLRFSGSLFQERLKIDLSVRVELVEAPKSYCKTVRVEKLLLIL